MSSEDLTNQVFGKWSVIGRVGGTSPIMWVCKCTCGFEKPIRGTKLKEGRSKGCESCKFASKDITGQRFGRLLVISMDQNVKDSTGGTVWKCRCDCKPDKELLVPRKLIKQGKDSCGCLWKENVSNASYRHGGSHDPIYKVWCGIKQRCDNPNNDSYYLYGGRGISMCDRWKESYANFRDDMGPRPEGYWIERVDSNGDYCPENCKWADTAEQASTRSPKWTYKSRY